MSDQSGIVIEVADERGIAVVPDCKAQLLPGLSRAIDGHARSLSLPHDMQDIDNRITDRNAAKRQQQHQKQGLQHAYRAGMCGIPTNMKIVIIGSERSRHATARSIIVRPPAKRMIER